MEITPPLMSRFDMSRRARGSLQLLSVAIQYEATDMIILQILAVQSSMYQCISLYIFSVFPGCFSILFMVFQDVLVIRGLLNPRNWLGSS